MKMFKNKIDKLVINREKLELRKTQIRDEQNRINSNIETRQKALQDLTFRNKDKADAKIADINRQIRKINKLINIEVDYANELEVKFEEKK